MIRRKLNRNERPDGRPVEDLADEKKRNRHLPLVCRECQKMVSKDHAIKAARQSLRCPHCGGLLDRKETDDGQEKR